MKKSAGLCYCTTQPHDVMIAESLRWYQKESKTALYLMNNVKGCNPSIKRSFSYGVEEVVLFMPTHHNTMYCDRTYVQPLLKCLQQPQKVFLLTHFTIQIKIKFFYKINHGPNAPNLCIETLPPETQKLANYT